MTLWVCNQCGCEFAVGLRACPQCTSESAHEKGEEMAPKATVHGGATYDQTGEDGNEWDGNKPSTSSEKEQTTGSDSSPSDPSLAQTTENPSGQDLTGSSSAPSTDGVTADAADADPYEGKTNDELKAELAKRELPVSGNKAELLERLQHHDAELKAAAESDEVKAGE